MSKKIDDIIERNKENLFSFLHLVVNDQNKLLLQGNLIDIFHSFQDKVNNNHSLDELESFVNLFLESISLDPNIYIGMRENIAESKFYHFNIEELYYCEISALEFMKIREYFVNPNNKNEILTIDFKPFYKNFPSIPDTKSIGNGFEYLNKYLSSLMFTNSNKWENIFFKFLKLHQYQNKQLILNEVLQTPDELKASTEKAINLLKKYPENESYENIKLNLEQLGFTVGLGKNVKIIKNNLILLDKLLHSPDYISLKDFISQIPMIFNVAIVSPHGYFAQDGVLGLPDTGGQVVYILDQVKALEKALIDSLDKAGLNILPKIIILTRLIPNAGNTKCNVRLEKIYNTKNTWILRVPFRNDENQVNENWISRFEVYPYLENFAEDSYKELLSEFNTKPDLIIGNYTDGNIVATSLSKKFDVTQCNIAHALEKNKYLYSAMFWENLENQYYFSIQFTADLIAMNAADFIITSTYQEIAGTEKTLGQYESYKYYTFPELYRVIDGINLYHPKFNVLSPGANEKIFFPYYNEKSRLKEIREELNEIVFSNITFPFTKGYLKNPDLIPIFSLARLDKIKNLTSLARWFGESKELQKYCNLVIVAGKINSEESMDLEEKEEINYMHSLFDQFNLHKNFRWIGKHFRKDETGELYRIIADKKGIFVQPGLFEGFGLTVIEAMSTGLPTFATKYGGPSEIIEDGISGFHIDPINAEESKEKILKFVESLSQDSKNWNNISKNAIKRVQTTYNWKIYSNKLLSLAKIYGFWRYSFDIDLQATEAYLDVLHQLLYKERVKQSFNIS
ncbi:MAG: sucrose synthase [Ignavibacterium sp.]